MDNVRELYPSGSLKEADLKKDVSKHLYPDRKNKLLEIKTANEWIEDAKSKPIPNKLLDCLFYEGELSILFADTNLGKSILAVQLADALTKGKAIEPFNASKKLFKVLYCDFEMSSKQFENRYSYKYADHYEFDKNFHRAELNLDDMLINSKKPLEELICEEIMIYITQHEVDVVIIDNLTYIAREIEKSNHIQPLMQKLKSMTKDYGVSIIVLAHTPKRDMSNPLTNKDIAGSKFLSNFADSIVAIGKSAQDEELRYIKQIKSRNSSYVYGSNNVPVFIIEKDHNFLQFVFQYIGEEQDHLRILSKEEKEEMDKGIINEYEKNPKLSLQNIANKLGTNRTRVKRVLDKYKQNM